MTTPQTGTLRIRRSSEGAVQLTRMRVAPRQQGRGMGQDLLDALHSKAAELGYEILRLDTTVKQKAAQRLYEKSGYRKVGRGTVGPFRCVYYERNVLAR